MHERTQATGEFDFISTMEDLTNGQRIGNYSIDYQRKGSDQWEVLVPPVQLVVSLVAQPRSLQDIIRARAVVALVTLFKRVAADCCCAHVCCGRCFARTRRASKPS